MDHKDAGANHAYQLIFVFSFVVPLCLEPQWWMIIGKNSSGQREAVHRVEGKV
ncbi:hypothetical protein BDZ94DRAFT_1246434 [Collybia nuda]|uniref:Uncharacterized protein n=1 Tax=Collybia nuda TaxID=64659 RepID=A0A9P6CQ52_9AGAR|nr:hypothetical protein BDZ94DRAFT_1246434 [Collybia nuda]